MSNILNEIEYGSYVNGKVVEMTNYLNDIVRGFADVVIVKRSDGGIIVVPIKSYIYSLGLETSRKLNQKIKAPSIEKNIFTYWSHRDYITLDIRPYLIANSKDVDERQNCRFYGSSELKSKSISEKIVGNYGKLKDKVMLL
ncbi:hypothetical protein GTH52_02080 [Clostridium tyrobutyricum]|uniref:Uncharacterized protein n=1 Tax=Clostridium tyrobutyricum DIVETGP TaxID=1408889 RepID=W6N5R7_CLOTY|nr:hypothetical protein [Clostridium tyrobutyricum]AND85362.1 hypothetical protein CTK_C21100 [Clostridium tyrobutyricum]ANP69912.1 hypothetical protein BA182_09535 [Clostridium tyrobutyricum]MBV4435743.1 hypothetical protein [Clostridium tyrobutyricum]QNB65727.1 hypothetical protein GTH52_02080 [Clostridium tyrobutyricum]CDL91631.1 hypothetical protein CTDIVETGP_1701 [Clostridium tyrobutyricum DIVETGP]